MIGAVFSFPEQRTQDHSTRLQSDARGCYYLHIAFKLRGSKFNDIDLLANDYNISEPEDI